MGLITIIRAALLVGAMIMSDSEEKGIIGEVQEDGSSVIFKLVDELPDESIRANYSWLTVIAWKYDGSDRNGMPPKKTNERMVALEHTIEESLESEGLCRHAYSRTGNNLKELVYYIADRDKFMAGFNSALADHPRYPIEINFYKDPEWEDFRKIQSQFPGNSEAMPPN